MQIRSRQKPLIWSQNFQIQICKMARIFEYFVVCGLGPEIRKLDGDKGYHGTTFLYMPSLLDQYPPLNHYPSPPPQLSTVSRFLLSESIFICFLCFKFVFCVFVVCSACWRSDLLLWFRSQWRFFVSQELPYCFDRYFRVYLVCDL